MSLDFEYLIERMCLLESGYVFDPENKKSDLKLTNKAIKILKKNPVLAASFKKPGNFGFQALHRKNPYGDVSYNLGSAVGYAVRGIGIRDPKTKKYIMNWVGSHEEYNKIKNQD